MEFFRNYYVDEFYQRAINTIYTRPNYIYFNMDGGIALGKSSNFTMRGAIDVAEHVRPKRVFGKLIRRSRWVSARENENATVATLLHVLSGSIFTKEVMNSKYSPVTVSGNHPTTVDINYKLADGSEVWMTIECHGFNSHKAENRLKSQEFLGAIVFECQSLPEIIYHTLGERCGRDDTDNTVISKVIDGVEYTLSGLGQLKIVISDSNIPGRGHYHYRMYYDVPNKKNLPYLFLTPPEPLIRIHEDKVTDDIKSKYPSTTFDGKKTWWIPNPKIYHMTRHYEQKDPETGDRIPWTGYSPWYAELHRSDSEVRRNVLGRPDKQGGIAAVYPNFQAEEGKGFVEKERFDSGSPIYIGFDPGSYAGACILQEHKGHMHVYKTFAFEPTDKASTSVIFSGFIFPWVKKHCTGHEVIIVADPASRGLGKSIMVGATVSVRDIIINEMKLQMNAADNQIKYKYEDCFCSNHDLESRINALGYFVDQKKLTSDPDNDRLNRGLGGGYKYKTTKSGMVSHLIDKESTEGLLYSHDVEALQYPCVNIKAKLDKRLKKNKKKSRPAISKVVRK